MKNNNPPRTTSGSCECHGRSRDIGKKNTDNTTYGE